MILLLTLSFGSCAAIKAAGVSPWPILPEVPELVLSGPEKAQLLKWYSEDKALFEKVQKQGQKMRAIIKKYNEKARENNKRILESLGYSKELLEEIYGREGE